jgi:hypothetical protein
MHELKRLAVRGIGDQRVDLHLRRGGGTVDEYPATHREHVG